MTDKTNLLNIHNLYKDYVYNAVGGSYTKKEFNLNPDFSQVINYTISIDYSIKIVISKHEKNPNYEIISFLSKTGQSCLSLEQIDFNDIPNLRHYKILQHADIIYRLINIEKRKNCFNKEVAREGALLIKTLVSFLKTHQKKRKITIILQDTSYKQCNCKIINILARSHTLLTGKTWFMDKLEFEPISNINKKRADKNLKIINSTITKDYSKFIMKHLSSISKIKKADLKMFDDLLESNSNKMLKDTLIVIKEFNCCYFIHLIDPLMKKLKINDLYNSYFYMNL